jgi:hypothetical protein
MAVLRFAMKPRTMERGASLSAKLAVAYLAREGKYEPAREEVEYLTRESEATQPRGDLIYQETRNMPGWAYGDAYNFFESAATYERKNGRWAMGLEASLPRELTREQQRELTHDFLDSQLKGKPLLVVQHEPIGTDGLPQPHIHVLFSERTNDQVERAASAYFRRANPGHPERGGAAKDPFWHEQDAPLRARQAWADLTNAALERAGSPARVDPRSLYTRGIERSPEPKVGWQQDGLSQREAAKAAFTRAQEQQIAEEYWTQRKMALGLRPGTIQDRELVKEHVYAWSRDKETVIDRTPQRWQEKHQAWTQRKVERVKTYEHQRNHERSRTVPLPGKAHPRGHLEIDLDREEIDR